MAVSNFSIEPVTLPPPDTGEGDVCPAIVSPSTEQQQQQQYLKITKTPMMSDPDQCRVKSQKLYRCRKTVVTFSDDVVVNETEHFRDMSPEERAARWFTRDDFWFIKMDVLDHMKVGRHFGWEAIHHGERAFINSNGDVAVVTMRGIRSETSSRQRRYDQQETTRAVLNEQMLQRTEGMSPLPDVIAMLYNLMSFSCQQRALEMGHKDAVCVYGDPENYQKLEGIKNVLCEPMPMDSDMLCVEESFVQHLAQRGLCSAANSIEDWLFERYQKGQQLAQLRPSFDTANPRTKSCVKDHVPTMETR
jgi:hypothetical protein